MTLREMQARKAEIATELRALNMANPDALPAEAQNRWTELSSELTTLEARMARQTQIDELDRTAPADRVGGGAPTQPEIRVAGFDLPAQTPEGFDGLFLRSQDGQSVPVLEARHNLASFLPDTESRAQELGLGGFLRALYRGPQTELERRVMSESSIGSGGALVPVPVAAGVLDELRAATVSFRAGCRTVPMSSQSLTFGRLTKTPVGAWRAENAAIAEDESTFGQVKMTAKSWALRCKISRELLEDGQNVDSIIRTAFAASGALALDQAILFGDGTANSPTGIVNTAGVQTAALTGKLSNWDPILDGVLDLENVNAGKVSAMIMAPRTNRAIRGFKDANGNPLSAPADVSSIPRLTTTSVPVDQGAGNNASTIVMGDFSQVYVGMRTSLQISVLNEIYAENGQIGFVAWMRADVLVVRPQTLLTLTGITP
ncbi:MAG: phage major capsid protein [Acetobacter fabarum]|jgi:HK97 family phage major capsid protein|uniref:phage major capsid protein n=1 Tax=Acetobacter fabarum TaxID=483199 RepID=UPI00243192A3|nr:phage major capsid protein [Acetobacter fabarum]MCH4026029.1 phage major capsid protein [Acetobacter fabarum]MCH4054777.1 phage major capsid protein [Acetobacter fabarum]MCH4086110.1 phage major capsid protein [Acetobacter fabarum]MCH4127298.1 phage major capsid protein [Acetobacter fabarum]MCH4136646.1 phage major capsid protein [Acetobacter fabarum]